MGVGKYITVFIMTYIVYLIFSGSLSLYDLTLGALVAVVVSLLTAKLLITHDVKALNPIRLGWLVAYFIVYFLYYEVKAHTDVIKRILHPKMPINPGIVRVPYQVKSDYSIVTISNSITNTPGTVVVDLDEEKKVLYVHWINVKGVEPEITRSNISRGFEFFAKKIFE
ncbi:MAG: cation:proton antiporter [Desulfurococcales archaeon ex4484_42]|nr:MAG: cation:proton antiporter [Desulfurococcales archaeon ex4484_42]